MQGQIGTLYQDGKQLGGFLDWSIDLSLNRTQVPDSRVYKVQVIKSTAERFWLLSAPSEGDITAHYYQLIKDRLVLVNSHIVTADLGKTINKMVNRPLVMTWMN